MSQPHNSVAGLRIEVIENANDFAEAYEVPAKCFGEQINDGIWIPLNPGWETAEGRKEALSQLVERFESRTYDKEGRPNAIFLKAVMPSLEDPAKEKVVGFTIWQQISSVKGYGDAPENMTEKSIAALHPNNADEARYCAQLERSIHVNRFTLAKEKESASPPAFMALDLCAVLPDYQKRGIARKLVQWGLDEAVRRGELECMTEASVMGRHVYAKLGFQSMGEIDYVVDGQFADRVRPSNLYMRTKPSALV